MKLTRPFVIQPAANGVVIFPLSHLKGGALDIQQTKVFTNTGKYESNSAIDFLDDLINNGEPETETLEINPIPLDKE